MIEIHVVHPSGILLMLPGYQSIRTPCKISINKKDQYTCEKIIKNSGITNVSFKDLGTPDECTYSDAGVNCNFQIKTMLK